jgi:hypothetical protein
VRCLVKSFNERNSYLILVLVLVMKIATYKRLLIINKRKVRMTSSPFGLYELGYTRATMAIHKKLYNKINLE